MKKVPKLRFKEFTGEWEEKNILELCTMKARIGWQNLRKEEHLDKGDFYLVTGTDFYLNRIKWDTTKYVSEERYLQDKNIILKEGDILITKDGSIGKLAFIENIGDKKATLNNGIFRIRLEENNYYSKYLYYTFLSKRFKNFLQQLTAGSTIVHLYQKDFEKYKISYPIVLQEQEKIANFLSSVDKKISLTEEKLELFKNYKKGIMQKIFSQKLRFKDENRNDYPEWEEKKIGEIFKITRGYVLSKTEIKEKKDKDFSYPVYSSQTLNDGIMGFYNKYLYENSITWTTDGANAGTVKYRKGKFYCTNVCGVLISENYSNKCISEILSLETPKHVSYVGNPKLMNNVMKEIKIIIPSLQEQEKIANFLSSIDEKIEKIENELENLKEFKKGLLQQMFI